MVLLDIYDEMERARGFLYEHFQEPTQEGINLSSIPQPCLNHCKRKYWKKQRCVDYQTLSNFIERCGRWECLVVSYVIV